MLPQEGAMSQLRYVKGNNGKILKAIMNAIIPPGGAFSKSPADYDLLPRVDVFIHSYDPRSRFLFPFIFKFIQYSAFFSRGKVFTKLSQEKASDFLEEMENSPRYYKRAIMMMLKLITVLPFFDIDDVAKEIGYVHGACEKKH